MELLNQIEDSDGHIRLINITNNTSSTNEKQIQQTHQWLTQTEGLA